MLLQGGFPHAQLAWLGRPSKPSCSPLPPLFFPPPKNITFPGTPASWPGWAGPASLFARRYRHYFSRRPRHYFSASKNKLLSWARQHHKKEAWLDQRAWTIFPRCRHLFSRLPNINPRGGGGGEARRRGGPTSLFARRYRHYFSCRLRHYFFSRRLRHYFFRLQTKT